MWAGKDGNLLMEPSLEIQLPLRAAGFRSRGSAAGGDGGGDRERCTINDNCRHPDAASNSGTDRLGGVEEEEEEDDPWLLLTPLSLNEHFPAVVAMDAGGKTRTVQLDRSEYLRGIVVG